MAATVTQGEIDAMNAFYTLGGLSTTSDSSEIKNMIDTTIQNNFYTAKQNTQSLAESANAYAFYTSRNTSLTDVFTKLTEENKKTNEMMDRESTTSSRQIEINQWEYENKMETLFFLQLMFVTLCLCAGVLYLRHSNIFTASVTYLSLVVLGIILILILLNRVSYTYKRRDKRYWNRGSIHGAGAVGIGNCPS